MGLRIRSVLSDSNTENRKLVKQTNKQRGFRKVDWRGEELNLTTWGPYSLFFSAAFAQINAVLSRWMNSKCIRFCQNPKSLVIFLNMVNCRVCKVSVSAMSRSPQIKKARWRKTDHWDVKIVLGKYSLAHDVAWWPSCNGVTHDGVPGIRLWPPRRDKSSGVLIGADGMRRSDWPQCV